MSNIFKENAQQYLDKGLSVIPDKFMSKVCRDCNEEKHRDHYHVDKRAKDGLNLRCKPCRRVYRLQFKDRVRDRDYRAKYGFSLKEYNLLLKYQEGVCAICKTDEDIDKNLAVDHCHLLGHVRGLLCRRCNTVLGLLEDKEELFLKCIIYLKGGTSEHI